MKQIRFDLPGILLLALLLVSTHCRAAETPETNSALEPGTSDSESPTRNNALSEKRDLRNGSASDLNEFGLLTAIGVQAGPNFSSVSATTNLVPAPDPSGRARMMFGANIDIGLGFIFFVEPEVDYIQRGFTETSTTNGTVTQLTVSLSYLEFPVLLKMRPRFPGRFKPFAVFGPSMGFLISRSAGVTSTDPTGVVTNSTDLTRESQFNTVLFSLNGGAGVDFELADAVSMAFSLRYSAGLSNWESSAAGATIQRTTSGSSIQLLAGIQFFL